eukprot:m.96744 g.96744  ORF g.96744 m.96744 type:complete len:132 (-) comp15057_c0_seq8:50-445(-)
MSSSQQYASSPALFACLLVRPFNFGLCLAAPFYSCGHQAGTFTNPKMDCKLKDCATGLELPAVVFGTLVNKVLGLPLATKPWEEKDRVAKRANKMTKAQKPQVFRIKKQAWQGRVSLNVTEVEELEDVVVV